MTAQLTIQCANCQQDFSQRRSNQKYCSNECCKIATNRTIIERYHANKLKKNSIRFCECGNKLSKYNLDSRCHACQLKKEAIDEINLLQQLGFSYEEE